MRRVLYLSLLLFVFVSSCQKKEVTTQPVCEEIFPFGITSTVNGFYIYPYGDEIKEIKKAEFWFYKTRLWGRCYKTYPSNDTFKAAVTYTTSSKEKILYVNAKEGEVYIVKAKIDRRCKGHLYSYSRYSGLIGTQKVKHLPFEDFDAPILDFSTFQSADNFLYYGGFIPFCKQLPEEIDKYITVKEIDCENIFGCFTLSNDEGVYCESATDVVKVYAGNVDKFYSLLWKENLYRVYILAGDNFVIYDFSPVEGTINKVFEDRGVRDVFPTLSHTYNKWFTMGDKVFYGITYYSIYQVANTDITFLNRMKYFYLLKATDETMVEILKPDLTKDYEWYWKPVSAVSYYFMEVTLPIIKREDYLPRGVVFNDGSVYLKDFRKEYKFPFKIKKLWMMKYPEKFWDGNYSGFMVGSDGYTILVSDATHFDYVKFRDYNQIRDISWSSVIGKDGSFTSLMLLYSKDLKSGYENMCKTHNLRCNILYFWDRKVLCDQLEFPIWDNIVSATVNFYPFLPSTRKWYVDCGEIELEVK